MKNAFDPGSATWRKSTFSADAGACVELAMQHGVVALRDSKDPNGPMLTFRPDEWTAFLNGVKNREFELQ